MMKLQFTLGPNRFELDGEPGLLDSPGGKAVIAAWFAAQSDDSAAATKALQDVATKLNADAQSLEDSNATLPSIGS